MSRTCCIWLLIFFLIQFSWLKDMIYKPTTSCPLPLCNFSCMYDADIFHIRNSFSWVWSWMLYLFNEMLNKMMISSIFSFCLESYQFDKHNFWKNYKVLILIKNDKKSDFCYLYHLLRILFSSVLFVLETNKLWW